MRHAKKIVSLFLTLVMCAGFMSLSAFAELTWPEDEDLEKVINFNDYTATNGIDAPNATFNELSGNDLNVNSLVTLEGGAVFSTKEVTTLDDNTKFWGKWEAEFVMIPSQDIPSGTMKAYGQYTSYSNDWVGIDPGTDITAGTTVRVIKDALPNDFKDMIAGELDKQVSALNGIPFAVVAYAVQTFQCGLDVLDYTKLVPGTSVDLELRLYAPRGLTVAEITAVGAIEKVNLQYDSELGLYYLLIGKTNTFNFPVGDNYVARTGGKNYETLQAAFDAAETGDTVTLLTNVALTDRVFVNAGEKTLDSGNRYAMTTDTRSITLDLNGHNITSTSNIALAGGSLNVTGTGTISTSTSGLAPIEVRGTGDLTAKRTLTIGENVTLSGACYGLNVFGSNNNTVANNIEVNINGTINGMVFVIGNLYDSAAHNIVINVNDGATIDAITHTTAREENVFSGIAQNGFATVNVKSGASIKGETGIELRAGTLNVSGGTIEGTAHPTSAQLNNNGTTTMGAGIGVASYDNSAVTLNVTNGTIKGYTPLYFSNFNGSTKSLNLSVSGGSFTVTQEGTDSVANNSSYSETRAAKFITGGYYSTEPDTSYLAEGYTAQAISSGTYNGYYKVVKSGTPVAEVDGVQYVDLQDAIDAAKDGDIIRIIANFTIDSGKTAATDRIVVDKAVTIDFGEYTMTVPGELEPTRNWSALYVDADVTITGTTGGIYCADKTNPTGGCGVYAVTVRNGANLTIDGGVYHGGGSTVYVIQGCATINGGTFTATTFDDPYGMEFLLNCLDENYQNGTAGINVKGGIFTSYNPSESVSEYPHANFVATGYKVDRSGNIYTVVLDTDKYETVTTTADEETKDVQTVAVYGENTVTDTFVKATSEETEFAEVAYAIKVETKNTSTSVVTSTVYNPVAAAVTTTSDVKNVDNGKVVTNDATEEKVTEKVTEIKDTLMSFNASVAASSGETSVNILNTTAASNAIAAAAAQTAVTDKSAIAEVEVQLNTKLEGYTIASTGTVEKVIYDVKPVAVVKNGSGTQIGDAVTLTNADLAAQNLTLTFTLPVPDDLVDTTQTTSYVKVTHTHENSPETSALYEVKGSAGGYYIESESGDFSLFTLEKVVLDTTGDNALVAYQLILDGSIGVDLYFTLNDAVKMYSNAAIRLTPVSSANGSNKVQSTQTKTYLLSSLTPLKNNNNEDVVIEGMKVYEIEFKTFAKELYDKITVELINAGDQKFTGAVSGHSGWLSDGAYKLSVIDLAQHMSTAAGVTDKGKVLAKALENFGYYTTKYLKYKTDPDDVEAVTGVSLPEYKIPGVDELGDISNNTSLGDNKLTYTSMILYMDNETGLRLLFRPASGYSKDNFTFTVTKGGETVTGVTKGYYDADRFYVLIPNIASSDLNELYTISITCNGDPAGSFTRSAMNWVNNIHITSNEGKPNYQFAEALRQYNLAADAYFTN